MKTLLALLRRHPLVLALRWTPVVLLLARIAMARFASPRRPFDSAREVFFHAWVFLLWVPLMIALNSRRSAHGVDWLAHRASIGELALPIRPRTLWGLHLAAIGMWLVFAVALAVVTTVWWRPQDAGLTPLFAGQALCASALFLAAIGCIAPREAEIHLTPERILGVLAAIAGGVLACFVPLAAVAMLLPAALLFIAGARSVPTAYELTASDDPFLDPEPAVPAERARWAPTPRPGRVRRAWIVARAVSGGFFDQAAAMAAAFGILFPQASASHYWGLVALWHALLAAQIDRAVCASRARAAELPISRAVLLAASAGTGLLVGVAMLALARYLGAAAPPATLGAATPWALLLLAVAVGLPSGLLVGVAAAVLAVRLPRHKDWIPVSLVFLTATVWMNLDTVQAVVAFVVGAMGGSTAAAAMAATVSLALVIALLGWRVRRLDLA